MTTPFDYASAQILPPDDLAQDPILALLRRIPPGHSVLLPDAEATRVRLVARDHKIRIRTIAEGAGTRLFVADGVGLDEDELEALIAGLRRSKARIPWVGTAAEMHALLSLDELLMNILARIGSRQLGKELTAASRRRASGVRVKEAKNHGNTYIIDPPATASE